MSTDLENIIASFGLVRREFKDVHAVVSRLDIQVRRLAQPRARPRPGGLVARLAACHLIAHKEKRRPAGVCRQHFAVDRDLANLIELKGAVTPAQTTVATWAAELAAVVGTSLVLFAFSPPVPRGRRASPSASLPTPAL
jgi:hypothetical protein